MVYLCLTQRLIDAIRDCESCEDSGALAGSTATTVWAPETLQVGQPISHSQIIALHSKLRELQSQKPIKDQGESPPLGQHDFNYLLQGSSVWTEPPKPKPVQTDEYRALMARLRAEQEEQSYTRMLAGGHQSHARNSRPSKASPSQRNPDPSSFAHLFPDSRISSAGRAYSGTHDSSQDDSVLYDDTSMATVNRQLALIANILVSIIATAVAVWCVTWHWGTGARLGLSMGGSGLVGIAEVVVYLGYISRLDQAKAKEKRKKEKKVVTKTWIIESRKGQLEKRTVRLGDDEDELDEARPTSTIDGARTTSAWPGAPGDAKQRSNKARA